MGGGGFRGRESLRRTGYGDGFMATVGGPSRFFTRQGCLPQILPPVRLLAEPVLTVFILDIKFYIVLTYK